jgi:hypothetical protein
MKRIAATLLAVSFGLAPLAARSADVPYAVFVDGRGVDAQTPSGLARGGVVFVNVVRAVRTFDGLLTFAPGGLTRVTLGGRTVDFHTGNRIATSGTARLRLPGAPFVVDGETYVPLGAIAAMESAKLVVDSLHHRALLTTAPPPPPPTATPAAIPPAMPAASPT